MKDIDSFFCGTEGHKKNHCIYYDACCAKKSMLFSLVCSKVNLNSVPKHTWQIDSSVTTHISMSMQGCLRCQKPSGSKRYISLGNDKMVEVKAIRQI